MPDNDAITYQHKLNALATPFEQYIFELEHSTSTTIDDMLDWQYGRANCMDVRYEDLFQDRSMVLWSSILTFLGFDGADQDFCKETFWKYSLFGEAPGANRRHARSGEVAQWKHVFSPELAEAFVDRFPDALQVLGYETDDRVGSHSRGKNESGLASPGGHRTSAPRPAIEVHGAGRHLSLDQRLDLAHRVEGLALAGGRREAADMRRGDHVRQPRQFGRRHLIGCAADIHGGAGDDGPRSRPWPGPPRRQGCRATC